MAVWRGAAFAVLLAGAASGAWAQAGAPEKPVPAAAAPACTDADQSPGPREQARACDAVLADPAASTERKATAHLIRGELRMLSGEFAGARADLDEAVAGMPLSGRARSDRGELLAAGGALQAALTDLNVGLDLEPSARAYEVRGKVFEALGDATRALADYEAALQLQPDRISARQAHAVIRYNRHDPGAGAEIDALIERKPKEPVLYALRSMAYLFEGDLDHAQTFADRLVALDPKTPSSWRTRALVQTRRRALDAALADLAQAEKVGGAAADDAGLRIALLMARGDTAGALALGDSLTAKPGAGSAAVVARCLAYIAGADPAKAEAICLPDWAKHPDTIATYEARGLLRLKQGRDQEAFEALDACVKARAWDAEPLYGRGLARLRLGRKAEAEADMAEARRLRPDIAARYADFGIR